MRLLDVLVQLLAVSTGGAVVLSCAAPKPTYSWRPIQSAAIAEIFPESTGSPYEDERLCIAEGDRKTALERPLFLPGTREYEEFWVPQLMVCMLARGWEYDDSE